MMFYNYFIRTLNMCLITRYMNHDHVVKIYVDLVCKQGYYIFLLSLCSQWFQYLVSGRICFFDICINFNYFMLCYQWKSFLTRTFVDQYIFYQWYILKEIEEKWIRAGVVEWLSRRTSNIRSQRPLENKLTMHILTRKLH